MPSRDPRHDPVHGDNLRNEKANKNHYVNAVQGGVVWYTWFDYGKNVSGTANMSLARWREYHAFWTVAVFGDNAKEKTNEST